ncbi:LysR family transcriptional regulator [Ponticoccus sp. (in: a-proteobacteria)]|uniref:LysR family transcriptional regulator n=1 Tax=Ponticoccus sp. (in: a-proteobacteria) TaxID=1925025 RepID=UPI003AB48791
MQIHSLRTFYWVNRLGSFRKAAEVLNISQPTVSARIRGLEDELGVPLMLRDAGLCLTPQGEELLGYARQVLRLTDDLSFQNAPQSRASRLRLGANGPVAATWLMALVDHLEAQHPTLRLEIEVNQSATLLKHLATGQLDLAILSTDTPHPDLKLTPLGKFPMIWVGAPSRYGDRLDDEALSRSPIIGYNWESPIHDSTRTPAFGPGRHHRFAHSDSLFMMIRLAVNGMGLALVPEHAVQQELASGQLVRITVERHPAPLEVCAAYRRETLSPPAQDALTFACRAMPPR